jgi:hypothetical protein
MRRLLVQIWLALALALFASHAYAETIAMLPLDGEKKLEIYGQPMAAEIARALKAAGFDVVVGGARMDVPDQARLIVDGTIKSVKGKQIEVSIRVRDSRDGTVLDTLPAPATKLDDLDKAAAELSARVVPSVKHQLEILAKPAVLEKPTTTEPKLAQPRPVTAPQPVLAASLKANPGADARGFESALEREVTPWAALQHVDATVTFEVKTYAPEKGKPAMARARVRVTIKVGDTKFDRVVRTDTIVGDNGSTDEQLATRTAREVLAIVRPNVRRVQELETKRLAALRSMAR